MGSFFGWGQFTGIGPLCDILTGYMFPGYPMANVFFRMYSAESIVQGLAYLRCSKLGHYMKIPPRELFTVLVFCQLDFIGTACEKIQSYIA